MSGGRRGLDVVNDVIISVDNINDEQLYTMHKPHKPPYMDPHMKSRFIWVHKTKGYVSYPLADLCQNSDATFFVRWRRPANGRLRGDMIPSRHVPSNTASDHISAQWGH